MTVVSDAHRVHMQVELPLEDIFVAVFILAITTKVPFNVNELPISDNNNDVSDYFVYFQYICVFSVDT